MSRFGKVWSYFQNGNNLVKSRARVELATHQLPTDRSAIELAGHKTHTGPIEARYSGAEVSGCTCLVSRLTESTDGGQGYGLDRTTKGFPSLF